MVELDNAINDQPFAEKLVCRRHWIQEESGSSQQPIPRGLENAQKISESILLFQDIEGLDFGRAVQSLSRRSLLEGWNKEKRRGETVSVQRCSLWRNQRAGSSSLASGLPLFSRPRWQGMMDTSCFLGDRRLQVLQKLGYLPRSRKC